MLCARMMALAALLFKLSALEFLTFSFKANSNSALHNSNTLSDILVIFGRIVHEVENSCCVQEPQLQVPHFF